VHVTQDQKGMQAVGLGMGLCFALLWKASDEILE
jgi:hypothetical protein